MAASQGVQWQEVEPGPRPRLSGTGWGSQVRTGPLCHMLFPALPAASVWNPDPWEPLQGLEAVRNFFLQLQGENSWLETSTLGLTPRAWGAEPGLPAVARALLSEPPAVPSSPPAQTPQFQLRTTWRLQVGATEGLKYRWDCESPRRHLMWGAQPRGTGPNPTPGGVSCCFHTPTTGRAQEAGKP